MELAKRLAQAHITQADPHGSDVRADIGEIADTRALPRRPNDLSRWRWKTEWTTKRRQEEHITFLEVLASHSVLVWNSGKRVTLRRRFLHLVDHQAALSALARSRFSSEALQRVLRRDATVLIAAYAELSDMLRWKPIPQMRKAA